MLNLSNLFYLHALGSAVITSRTARGYWEPLYRSLAACDVCRGAAWFSGVVMPHHWCLSERPFQSGSVRTMRSISFFHSIPSEMTRCHSLHTSSAEHSERASRNDRMFSAMWSRPWAASHTHRIDTAMNIRACLSLATHSFTVPLHLLRLNFTSLFLTCTRTPA